MCLSATNAAVCAAKKIRQKQGSVYAWKFLLRSRTYSVNSEYTESKMHFKLVSPLYIKKWKPGVNKSTRRKAELTQRELALLTWQYATTDIECGIHVFVYKKDALREFRSYGGGVVVRVKCDNADLVARNYQHSYTREAVYTKVTLSKEEYDKALKG